MAKWKCEICGSEFENYQAQGFNHKIYCPLCYFKELYKREKQENQQLKKQKDDAIKYIKKNIIYEDLGDGYSWNFSDDFDKNDLLRMLGEEDG